MCIAVYKPKGQKMPSKKIFSNCFSNNDDGAGFMFPLNGKVHYEKGFMSFTAFKKGLKKAIKNYGINTITTPMVFHFRITSQGGVKPELTHPFPVCRSYDEMRKLSGDVDYACVHNGIIDFASSYSTTINYSDTMEFIKEVVAPLIYKNPTYYKNKSLMGILSYLLDVNRFIIMGGDGHTELIGNWIEEKGIYYSNSTYKTKKYSLPTKSCVLDHGDWKLLSDYNHYQDYRGYDYDEEVDNYWYAGYIDETQEKMFLEEGILQCCCGEEMIIEYVDYEDAYYAFCFDCGMKYKLTKKAADYAIEHNLVSYSVPSDCDEEDDTLPWDSKLVGARR